MNLKEIINDVLRDHDFGEPWRLSEGNIGIVVPILRKTEASEARDYLMLEEAMDKTTIEDSGSIDNVKVRVDADKPVFIRGGGMLKGQGTQSRAVQFGTVVMPQKEQLVPVLCVHASHGINPSAFFAHAGYAPRRVAQRLASHDQGAAWGAVHNYARASALSLSAGGIEPHFAHDDLVRAVETVERFKTDVEEALKKVPGDLENQVGVAILNVNGVAGVETFDHPDSWHALSSSIIRQYKDIIIEKKAPDYLSINMEKVEGTIRSFLEKAKESEETEVHGFQGARTALIQGEIVGEYTLISERAIHLLLTRKEPEPERREDYTELPRLRTRTRRIRPAYTPVGGLPSYTSYTTTVGGFPASPQHFFRRRGGFKFLASLDEGPKPWADIVPAFKSTATLSKRAKEAMNLGLVEKSVRLDNGRDVYNLTTTGQVALKKIKRQG